MNQELEILLIEDNPHDAELVIRALKKNHVVNHIVHLTDGVIALDFLFGRGKYEGRKTNIKPRLILLDLKMPKMNGLEVLQAIKDNDLTKQIPVVVLTSSKENPDIEQSYLLGANSFIVKPVDYDSFRQVITDLGMYWLVVNHPPH
ncbi:MAG: response regulator [Bacteroidetes bacterium]|nr:response regulator [Bacteroidota bacterium]